MKKLIIIFSIIFCLAITAYATPIEVVCVLDKSGSMEKVQEDIVGSFNTFLSNQKASSPEAMLTLALFDTNIILERKAIKDFEPLTADQYKPEGRTALYDAIGITITDLESTVTKETIVIFAIITDGLENESHVFNSEQIKYRISHYESWHPWTFLFLAANQDAFVESQKMGIADGHWLDTDLSTTTDCNAAFDIFDNASTTLINDGSVNLQGLDKVIK